MMRRVFELPDPEILLREVLQHETATSVKARGTSANTNSSSHLGHEGFKGAAGATEGRVGARNRFEQHQVEGFEVTLVVEGGMPT